MVKNCVIQWTVDLEKVDSCQLLSGSSVGKLIMKAATTLVLMIGVLVSSVSAEPKGSVCPPEWIDIVKSIGIVIVEEDASLPVLLFDRNGKFHDCTKADLDPRFVKRAELMEQFLPFDRTSDLSPEPSSWPTNICSTSQTELFELRYIGIHLPNDPAILSLRVCRDFVLSSLKSILNLKR